MSRETIHSPVSLEARFRHYAWGDLTFIPELYGMPSTGEPWAEAWLGAHPALPALAGCGDQHIALDQLIAKQQKVILGSVVARRFGGLPFLLKIIAVAQALSIQVHPSRSEAAAGFRRENNAGLALDSPQRNYRDANPKPELIVALTDFYALCGFRPLGQIMQLLEETPELYALMPRFGGTAHALSDWLKVYYQLPPEQIYPALLRWLTRLEASGGHRLASPHYWVLKSHCTLTSKPDRGLLFFLLLNLIKLEPRQGLYLPAGMPHSYLQGAGVEVMAESDNVVRGGLTAKHIDVDELLRITQFEFTRPPLVLGVATVSDNETVYPTPAREFELHLIRVNKQSAANVRIANGPEILLALDRIAVAVAGHRRIELGAGGGCLISHRSVYRITAANSATLVRAIVPAKAAQENG